MKQKRKSKLVIEQLDVDLIKPYWRNPRQDTAEQSVPFVAASIERYGFNVPLVIDKKSVIITGHTRYRAARQLGLKTVPVIRAKLSEGRARQFRIADNKTAELAQWSPALTAELLGLSDLATVRALFGGPMWDSILKTPQDAPDEPQSVEAVAGGYDGSQFEVLCPHCGKENIVRPQDAVAVETAGDGV